MQARFGQGEKQRIWTGVVVKTLEQPTQPNYGSLKKPSILSLLGNSKKKKKKRSVSVCVIAALRSVPLRFVLRAFFLYINGFCTGDIYSKVLVMSIYVLLFIYIVCFTKQCLSARLYVYCISVHVFSYMCICWISLGNGNTKICFSI